MDAPNVRKDRDGEKVSQQKLLVLDTGIMRPADLPTIGGCGRSSLLVAGECRKGFSRMSRARA